MSEVGNTGDISTLTELEIEYGVSQNLCEHAEKDKIILKAVNRNAANADTALSSDDGNVTS